VVLPPDDKCEALRVNRLLTVARLCDRINLFAGTSIAWVTLLMVVMQTAVVVLRYVFGIGLLAMQQSVVYMHGIIFLVAAGYALKDDFHVRIDIFYSGFSRKGRALVNLLGSVLLLAPVCAVILVQGWPYVVASWGALEGAPEGTGLPGLFLLKTFILIYAGLLALQGIALAIRSALILLDVAVDDEPHVPEARVQ
jgi:TRAP-type mannitol/chloroaromatic compound transport system permease small subunit